MQSILVNRGTMEIPMTEKEENAIKGRVGRNLRISLIEADARTNTFIFEAKGSKGGPHRFQLPDFQWLDGEEIIEEEADDTHFGRWMSKRSTMANVPRELALTTCLIFNNERAISTLMELKEYYDSATQKQREILLHGTNTQRIEVIRKIIGVKLAYKFKLDKLNSNRIKAIAYHLCGKAV